MPSFLAILGHKKPAQPEGAERAERRGQERQSIKTQAVLYWWKEGSQYQEEKVELCDMSDDGFGVRLSHSLPAGLFVWIRYDDELLRGVIRHCAEKNEGYLAGVLRLPQERRRFDREPIRQTGTLRWSKYRSLVILRNITDDGLQLEVPDEVPVSSIVRLTFGDWECLGKTVYCKKEETSYLVGLHFVRPPWPQNAAEYED